MEAAGAHRETTAIGVTRMLDAIRHVDPEIRFYQASSSECSARSWRCRSGKRRRSTRAARTGSPRSTGTGSRSTTARATGSTSLRASCSTTSAAARDRVRHPQGHRRRCPDQVQARRRAALGNLDAKRDWGYAADYVRAMWLMLQQDSPGITSWRPGRQRSRARADCVRGGGARLEGPRGGRRAVHATGRGRPPRRRPDKANKCSAGTQNQLRELVEMMVEADLALVRWRQILLGFFLAQLIGV